MSKKKIARQNWSDFLCHAHPVWFLSLSNLKDSLELALPKLNCAVSFRRNTISYPSSKETFVKQSDIIGRLFKRRLDNVYESHRVTYV